MLSICGAVLFDRGFDGQMGIGIEPAIIILGVIFSLVSAMMGGMLFHEI